MLELFYADIARYTRVASDKVSGDTEGSITATLDTVLRGSSEPEQRPESVNPEERFMQFATRSAITIMFAFLRQAGQAAANPGLVESLLEDASGLVSELPLACLRKLYHSSPETSPDNWLFAFQKTVRFLEHVCETEASSQRTREMALVLRAHLAAATGSLKMMLEAISHMLQVRDLDMALLADLTARFADLKIITKTPGSASSLSGTTTPTPAASQQRARGNASNSSGSNSNSSSNSDDTTSALGMDDGSNPVAPTQSYLNSLTHPGGTAAPLLAKHQVPAMLLSHLARLAPPFRTAHDEVQVYGWGEDTNFELGFQRGRTMNAPTLSPSLSQLRPLHITLANKTTFVIDSEGKLWSCGHPASRLLAHDGHGLKLVSGLESERFVQVAGIDHVLALTARGEVYSWGNNSYAQLGRAEDALVPKKITRGFSDQTIAYIAAGSQHSAAVSESGVLFTWGRGSYGRLGHGSSDDVPFPQVVEYLVNNKVPIATVACGLGDAHTLALSRDGVIFAFGDGDFGKLGLGSTERTRLPVPINFPFDGTKVRQVWCGRQISACLTEGGALYTWGSAAAGALGNGEGHATCSTPKQILRDCVIKSVSPCRSGGGSSSSIIIVIIIIILFWLNLFWFGFCFL